MKKALLIHWDKTGRNIVCQTPPPAAGNFFANHLGRVHLPHQLQRKRHRTLRPLLSTLRRQIALTRQVPVHAPEIGVRDKNGYASATPVTDGKRVVSFLGSCGLVCHDFDGNLLLEL